MTIRQDPTHPTGVVDDTPRGNSNVARARMRKAYAALEMRRQMKSWDEIAATLGFPTPRAALVATEKALEDHLKTQEGQTFMRHLATERYELLLKSVWDKAQDDTRPDHLAYLDRARLLLGDHARLNGYEAPRKQVVTTPTSRQIMAFVQKVVAERQPDVEEADVLDVDWYADDEETDPLALEAPHTPDDTQE